MARVATSFDSLAPVREARNSNRGNRSSRRRALLLSHHSRAYRNWAASKSFLRYKTQNETHPQSCRPSPLPLPRTQKLMKVKPLARVGRAYRACMVQPHALVAVRSRAGVSVAAAVAARPRHRRLHHCTCAPSSSDSPDLLGTSTGAHTIGAWSSSPFESSQST